jgi:protein-ribulosamine 3-kinase
MSMSQTYITEKGQAQAVGEYESTRALFSVIPDNVPRPVAVGTLASNPQKHFLLVEFRDMADELPPVPEFVAVIATLHQKSSSPNGKFGFDVPTSQSLQLENTWCDTWEEFFTRAMRGTVDLEQAIQGHCDELKELSEKMYTKVIPRLLRPMESGGRSLKPTLVHGDLWHGNVGVDMETDRPILFDCCAFYGHHECKCFDELYSLTWHLF